MERLLRQEAYRRRHSLFTDVNIQKQQRSSIFWRTDGTTSTTYLIPKCPLMAKNITGVKRSFGEPTHGQARRPSRGYEVPIKDLKVGKLAQ